MGNDKLQKPDPEIEPPPSPETPSIPPEIIPIPEKNNPFQPSPEINQPEPFPEVEPIKKNSIY